VCNPACLEFGRRVVREEEVRGRAVLDLGARDVNGSLRPHVEAMRPARYVGVDLEAGKGVDEVCDAGAVDRRFGEAAFDLVLSTELLEHVRDWRAAVRAMKRVSRPGGTLILTTRSKGFRYHGYPHDFWRYETDDLRAIFGDLEILALEPDPSSPGAFLKARKPEPFRERDLADVELYSIILRRRVRDVDDRAVRRFRFWYPLRRRLFGAVR